MQSCNSGPVLQPKLQSHATPTLQKIVHSHQLEVAYKPNTTAQVAGSWVCLQDAAHYVLTASWLPYNWQEAAGALKTEHNTTQAAPP